MLLTTKFKQQKKRGTKQHGGFAFLIHARSIEDFYRRYPYLRYIPNRVLEWSTRFWPPVLVSDVTGLCSQIDGKDIPGWIIGIPMTAKQMMENRTLALKKITEAVLFSAHYGVKIIGLGALTASLTRGGLDIVEEVNRNDIYLTTGHSYTTVIVTENVLTLAKIMRIPLSKLQLGVVGAAGSVGSNSARRLVRLGVYNLLLVDLERKNGELKKLVESLHDLTPGLKIQVSYHVRDIRKSDIIIAATNAPEVVIGVGDLKAGAAIVDDAQPSDIHPDVFKFRHDVLVVEGGVTHTPGIRSNFDFGLHHTEDNFCCMAEAMILAANDIKENFSLGRVEEKKIEMIKKMGDDMGFRIAEFQNFQKTFTYKEILSFSMAHKPV